MGLLISFIQKLTTMSIELKYLLAGTFSLCFVARPLFYLYTRGLTNNPANGQPLFFQSKPLSHHLHKERSTFLKGNQTMVGPNVGTTKRQ